MVIEKYGIRLVQLTHDKIELVRKWRNDPKIQQYMEYRQEITVEMQEAWFQKISSSGKDFFFIMEFEGEEVGLINVKNVDFEKKEGEPGIFIWDDDFLNCGASVRASLARNDFAWETLKLERLVSHVLSDNKRAIRYNKLQGFVLAPDQESVYNQKYILEKSNAIKVKEKLIKILKL